MATITAEQLGKLMALYRNRMGGGSGRSSWGQGGASAQARADRYAQLRSQGFTHADATEIMANGGIATEYGQDPTQAQLLDWAQTVGQTDPAVASVLGASRGRQQGGSQSSSGSMIGQGGDYGAPSTGNPYLDNLLAQMDQARNDAFITNDQRERNIDDQNLERQKQAYEALDALRSRVMGEVDNWGGVQEKLNQERSDSAMAAVRANLAARGLDSSSREAAYALRAARDLGLVQQDLSEKKSNRKIGYDTQLTDNLVQTNARLAGDRAAFLERPSDNAPDLGMIAQLALQAGEGGGGSGYFNGPQGGGGYAGVGGYSPRIIPNLAPAMASNPFMGGGQQQAALQQVAPPQAAAQPVIAPGPGVAATQAPQQGGFTPSDAQVRQFKKWQALQQRIQARRDAGYQKPRGAVYWDQPQ